MTKRRVIIIGFGESKAWDQKEHLDTERLKVTADWIAQRTGYWTEIADVDMTKSDTHYVVKEVGGQETIAEERAYREARTRARK